MGFSCDVIGGLWGWDGGGHRVIRCNHTEKHHIPWCFAKTSLAINHPTLEAIGGGGGSPSTLPFWRFTGPWLMQWGLTCMETQEVDKTVAPCVCKLADKDVTHRNWHLVCEPSATWHH